MNETQFEIEEKTECDRILNELNNQLIEKEKSKKSHHHQKIIIKNNYEKEDENQGSAVNIIINKYTNNFVSSQSSSDIIQSSLEYNNYLINKMIENSEKLTKSEFEYCANTLWKNLKVLSKNADLQIKSSNLSKNNKYTQIYTKMKSKETFSKNYSGLLIPIDKSILDKHPNQEIINN